MNETNVTREFIDLPERAMPIPRITVPDKYRHVPDNSRFISSPVPAFLTTARAAVFLDRDGVIVEDVHFLREPTRLRLLPGIARALNILKDQFYIIVVTNQSGIARGLLTEDTLLEVHSELVQRLATEGAILDALYYCPHLPEATIPAYQVDCNCRKPKPGMLLQAKRDWGINLTCSYIIGDEMRDVEAGHAAGVKGILLGKREAHLVGATVCAPDLAQAADLIMAQT